MVCLAIPLRSTQCAQQMAQRVFGLLGWDGFNFMLHAALEKLSTSSSLFSLHDFFKVLLFIKLRPSLRQPI